MRGKMANSRITQLVLIFFAMLISPYLGFAQSRPSDPLGERVKKLEDGMKSLESSQQFTSLRQRSGYATVDCDSKRFGTVQSDDDARFLVLVSCVNVEPYLEGYRVHLDIGNPYFMTIAVVRGTFYYGERSFLENKVEIPLIQGLKAGGWTRTIVNISRATAGQMRNMRSEFFVEQVMLSR